MKNSNSVVKFSLTLVCAAVLAACSSSGGSDNSAAEAKAKQEAAAQQAAKEAAEKATAEKAAAEAAEAKVKSSLSVGHKLVKKTDSDFALNISAESAGTTSSRSTGGSENMAVELYPSLDTVVVSVPLKKDARGNFVVDEKAPIGYVEDFDFRGNTDKTTGKYTLEHIYKTKDGATNVAGATRTETATKTATAGADKGTALVYQQGRTNYIPTDEAVVIGDTKGTGVVDRKGTVAEVYGHRTFVSGNSLVGADANGKHTGGEDAGVNAPFGYKDAKNKYTAHHLDNVQYGRVTSRLNEVNPASTKAGLNVGKNGTKVVSYGGYGDPGTENSYFYRGVNDTAYSATLATDLANAYAKDVNGVKTAATSLNYQGHAVTYGFTHSAPALAEQAVTNVPNAIGAEKPAPLPTLVSGTHVHAKIDLATKAVTGSLYDVYTNGDSNIATFTGTLNNSGAIAGTSTREADKAAGTFNGNLFGKHADELGGALASKETAADKSWGAVFGASVQESLYQAPVVKETSAWGVRTDENK